MVLMCIILVLLHGKAWASGYHPSFDRALMDADLVLQGEVVEMWDPFDKDKQKAFIRHSSYRFRVQKCYKGGLKSGAEVHFWDPHFNSTASYGIRSKGQYIVYLKPAKLSEYESGYVNPEKRKFYKPIRVRQNRETYAGSKSVEYYTRELRLLDFFVENPPADKRKAYQKMLRNDTDPFFLSYIIKDWPRPCTEEDIALFKRSVLSSDGNELYVRRMLGELVKHPEVLTDSDVVVLLQKGGVDVFPSLRALITDDNVKDVQALLFGFLRDVNAGGTYRQLIETLAALSPDYFKERLVAFHDFPLWKLLPCLKALDLNGSDLGMADFPEEIFSVRHNTLFSIAKILEGDLFWVSFPLRYPSNCADFKAALPLLEPMLKEKDSPVRRACVALFRTYGVPVGKADGIYTAKYTDAPAPCPIKLELRMKRTTFKLGEEIEFILKETAAVDGGGFCFEGKALTTLHFEGHWDSPESLGQQMWDNVEQPDASFVILEKGMSREEGLKLFRKIDRPGSYRIELKKCYLHDGGEHGLDAWTGMAFAENELVFTVTEP